MLLQHLQPARNSLRGARIVIVLSSNGTTTTVQKALQKGKAIPNCGCSVLLVLGQLFGALLPFEAHP